MRRIATFLLFAALFFTTTAHAQVTLDGVLDEAAYQSLATKANANSGFGPSIDVTEISYAVSVSDDGNAANDTLYLGIHGKLDPSNNNAIGIYLGFDELSGAAPGDTLGGVAGGGSYLTSPDNNGNGVSENQYTADFEVDYMFAVNPGSTADSVFFNSVKQAGGTPAASYLGSTDQSGTPASGPSDAGGYFGAGAVRYAFDNSGDADTGLEVAFSFSDLGVTRAGNLAASAFVVSATAYFSDVAVPGDITAGNLGYNPDFSADPDADGTAEGQTSMDCDCDNPGSPIGEGPYGSDAQPLPVELARFRAQADGPGAALLTWSTASETGNLGFAVQRRRAAGATGWQQAGFVESNVEGGTTASVQHYRFRMEALAPGTHVFRLRQVDRDGTASFSGTRRVEIAPDGRFYLSAAYPNPFHDRAAVALTLRRAQDVSVALYDALGREVARLHDGALSAGSTHRFELDGANLASGLYLLRASGEDFSATRTVTLVR